MHRLWMSFSSLPFWMTAFRSVSGKGQEPGKETQVSPWTQTPGKYPCHSSLGLHQAGG